MRTPINWNQPFYQILFCVLCLVGFVEVIAFGLLLTQRPPNVLEDQVRPQPTADLSHYSVKISSEGTATVTGTNFSPDSRIGPVQVFSAALQKHPDAKKFKMQWQMHLGSSWHTDKVLYNRRKQVLIFDEVGGQGEFRQEPVHSVRMGITDEIIHKLARRGNNGQSDGGFSFLR